MLGKNLRPRPTQLGIAAAWLGAQLMDSDLLPIGCNTDCIPLADVPVVGSIEVIGDRAYGETPARSRRSQAPSRQVSPQAASIPILKHIPGHGRAGRQPPEVAGGECRQSDSEASDFAAFRPRKIALGNDRSCGFPRPSIRATRNNIPCRDP